MTFAKLLQRTFGSANRAIYRATGGKLGNTLKGAPILLLTTKGRKSGKPRTMPLLYLRDGDRLVLVASSGGSPDHPAWFLNLRAEPQVKVEIGRDRERRRARVATPEERELYWPQVVQMYGGYADYQRRTSREIPLVVLEPTA
jgi:deazaflavin-dependent oxidoreductase (nitroreductase family)